MSALARFALVAVVLWAPLTVLTGYCAAAFAFGSLGAFDVIGACGLTGLFFSPVMLVAQTGSEVTR